MSTSWTGSRKGWSSALSTDDVAVSLTPGELDLLTGTATELPEKVSNHIQQASRKLVRTSARDPGFFFLSDLHSGRSEEDLKLQCQGLFARIIDHLEANYLGHFNPARLPAIRIRVEFNDGQLPGDIGVIDKGAFIGYQTAKRPHIDPNPFVGAMLYYPPYNISGGNLTIYDLDSFLADYSLTLDAVCEADHFRNRVIRREYEAELEPYGCQITTNSERPVFIMFSNAGSLMHGVSPVKVFDQTLPVSRRFTRFSWTKIVPNPSMAAEHI
ncbi:MAG TPA: hypothetical protein VLB76_19535 [Thermoanaerobaculia bacterium]|jgi:hypothetical protein|nr:hypothetical protein [Thermoanaerobaculia bacterium]